MNATETLILKSLQCKALHHGADTANIIDSLLSQNPEQADLITKNVCARIPLVLAEHMENLGALLELNKREIITLALIDFLEKAEATLTAYDAWPQGEVEA
jgi:hypothetical protein